MKEDLLHVQDTEENDLEKFFVVVIASLPYSLSKTLKTSSLEKALARLIVTNIESTSTQSIFAPI